MSDHFEQTIAELQKTLVKQEQEVIKTKMMINSLCVYANKPPLFSDASLTTSEVSGITRTDQFYGKPLASAVREVLNIRQNSNIGPATVKEIYELLLEGGYSFDAKDAQNAQRNLRISLAKNVALFHKLPNGRFGLVSWYPTVKDKTNKISKTILQDDVNKAVKEEMEEDVK